MSYDVLACPPHALIYLRCAKARAKLTGPSFAGRPSLMNGGRMVTTEEMRAMARRYDTTMAHAFRRALHVGGYVAVRSVARLFARRNRDARAYSGIRLCFRNYGSPMDGLR